MGRKLKQADSQPPDVVRANNIFLPNVLCAYSNKMNLIYFHTVICCMSL